jgi:hypothetical protein
LQLSVKSLLKPFNTALATGDDDDNNIISAEDNDAAPAVQDDSEEEGADDEGADVEDDVEDDNIEELQELSENEREQLLEETAAVRETITKVCQTMFTSSYITNISTMCTGTATFVYDYPFNHNRSPCLAPHLP